MLLDACPVLETEHIDALLPYGACFGEQAGAQGLAITRRESQHQQRDC